MNVGRHAIAAGRSALLVLAGILIAGGGYAVAAATRHNAHSKPVTIAPKTRPKIHGCVTKAHVLLIQAKCTSGQRSLSISPTGAAPQRGRRGPAGRRGLAGPQGPQGPTGPAGPSGEAAGFKWEVVSAQGQRIAGDNLGITRDLAGNYSMQSGTGAATCSIQITPVDNPPGVGAATVPPVIASVSGDGPSAQEIYLTTSAGTPVDDQFSVMIQC